MKKLFTKTAFTIALECPARLYYYYDQEHYANQNDFDEQLKSLAEQGNQIGDLAKLYYGVQPEFDLQDLRDYESSVERTKQLLQQEKITIAEAAFRSGDLFVRADLLVKNGNDLRLIEVKSTSYDFANQEQITAVENGSHCLPKYDKVAPKLFDVAFQKYVVTKALQEWGMDAKVRASLLLVDKSAIAGMDGMDHFFQLQKEDGHCIVHRLPGVEQLLALPRILRELNVDILCDKFIANNYEKEDKILHGMDFKRFVEKMADLYCNHRQEYAELSTKCYKCPYYATEETPGKADGYEECWMHQADFTKEDFQQPLLEELWSGNNSLLKTNLLEKGKYFLKDLLESDCGKSDAEWRWRVFLQVAFATNRLHLLAEKFRARIRDGVYLDREGLREEMSTWQYPLHFIDFETLSTPIPPHKGLHPNEVVAFQFSHHRVDKNADESYTITHAGQYLNTTPEKFPNFEFVRTLKAQLGQDNGTIFRYSHHENTVLNAIHQQLAQSDEADKQELMGFIESITNVKNKIKKKDSPEYIRRGTRDMKDLWEIVKRFYYHPSMKGSNSIKQVLPAVLKSSKLLQEKYSRPIYGSEIHSECVLADSPVAWVTKNSNGEIENPYKKLPAVSELLADVLKTQNITREQLEKYEQQADAEDTQVNNGGLAPIAYQQMLQCTGDDPMKKALANALLRYCELDTMSMVFIWEYFYHETLN